MANLYDTGRRPSTVQVTATNIQEPSGILTNTLTADRVHMIFRSAEAGNTQDLFQLYRDMVVGDSHIQAELNKRILAVLGDTFQVAAYNRNDEAEQAVADQVQQQLEDAHGWMDAMAHLLSSSSAYPVSLAEKVFAPVGSGYRLVKLVPVPHSLLDYRDRSLRVFETDAETGMVLHTSFEPEPERYIIHKGNLLTAPAYFGGPMRSLVVWWLLKSMDRTWWARFLDRYGSPFLVGKYDQADDATRTILETAFSWATRIGGLVVSREAEVEIKEAAAASSGEAYRSFLEICNREISKLILGQTLSSDAQSTGLGSGVANSQEAVRQDIRMFDAAMLASTVRRQLVAQILDANGVRTPAPSPKWGSISAAELQAMAALLASLKSTGLEIDDDAIEPLSDMVGFTLRRAQGVAATPFTAEAIIDADRDAAEKIIRGATAGVAQAFRARHADMVRAVQMSADPDQALDALVRLSRRHPASAVDQALAAFAANGASNLI